MAFTWDESIGKYRDAEGNVVPASKVRDWVDSLTEALALIFIGRAETLRESFTIENFQSWNDQTRVDLVALHYAVMMIAFGGQPSMDQDRWALAEAIIATQVGYFDSFGRDVISGTVKMDGMFPVRTGLYALAAFATHQAGVRIQVSKSEEKRVIGSGNPCEDCLVEAARGWVPKGTCRAIGDSVCRVRCRCYFVFR